MLDESVSLAVRDRGYHQFNNFSRRAINPPDDHTTWYIAHAKVSVWVWPCLFALLRLTSSGPSDESASVTLASIPTAGMVITALGCQAQPINPTPSALDHSGVRNPIFICHIRCHAGNGPHELGF